MNERVVDLTVKVMNLNPEGHLVVGVLDRSFAILCKSCFAKFVGHHGSAVVEVPQLLPLGAPPHRHCVWMFTGEGSLDDAMAAADAAVH